ncbi:MAG: hypothetical protein ACR2PS_18850 [Pseudomonadales bacterium]
MQLIAHVLVTISMLATSPTTLAGGGHAYGHYGHYGYDGYRGGHHRGHGRYYRPYRRAHRHRSHRGEYLVGGILLGSLIANSVHRAHSYPHRYVERRVYQPTRTVYTERRTETVSRRLLRDVNGDCFELHTAEDGSEVRNPIAREECSW